ncbi:MAG: right-handed parallel beta-helix repeat-containing protein, partial [Acidobacteriota bacterium]
WYPRPEKTYMSPAHTGINVYGRGHVVCYNRISRFSDGIAPANFGPPLEDVEKHPVAIDICNNDVSFAQDDAIETDYGAHNFRVYRNRCYNAHTGISVQPFYGGPVYLIRNEIYGVTALTFKLHNYCAGIVACHNTVASAGSGFQSFDRWQNGQFRNNLFLGGAGYAMTTGTITAYSTLDYNGYRRNAPGDLIRWFDGRRRALYASLALFSEATGHERHAVMVDYDIFEKAEPPRPGVTSDPSQYDLRLRQGALAVDAGTLLPHVNDDHAGRAPDLGCYELGRPRPHYGPRRAP